MGVFDFLTGQTSGGYQPPSPDQQGWAAYTQAQLGQPSRFRTPAWQQMVQGMINGTQAYQNASTRQGIGNALNSGDAGKTVDMMLQSQDPEMQKLALQTKMSMLIPQYGETKDAMGNPVAYNKLNPSQSMPIGGGSVFGGGLGLGNPATPGQPAQTGDDFLKTLPPQIGIQVKALADGKMPFPGGMALKTPYWQQMLGAVSQYDPNFDAINYNARSKVYQDLTSGKTSQNVKSIETALNTLSQAQDASDKLGGVNHASILTGPLNSAHQMIAGMENDPNLNTYNNYAKASADETTKAVIGAGGTGGDREARLIGANLSPDARRAAFQAQAQELASRLDPIASMANQGMGTSKNGIDILSPQAQANYYKLTGQAPANAHAGNAPVANDSAPIAAAAKPQAALPPAAAIAFLRANPSAAPAFEAKYGIPAASILNGGGAGGSY